MNSLQLFIIAILFGLLLSGCTRDNQCEDQECGLGGCVNGICECPDGFFGKHCEYKECFGLRCINGDCDPQTESCNCNPNYYGEECDILCVNGEFINGSCNCSVGYEGIACELESRDGLLGWWFCQQWTLTSQSVDSTFQGPLLGTIKFECGSSVPEIELFPTANSSGLMLLNSNNKILGQVANKTITFDLQYLNPELSVYGSASLGNNQVLSVDLYFFNSTTSITEVASGAFTLYRHLKDCN